MEQAVRRQKAERRKQKARLTPNPSPKERGVRRNLYLVIVFNMKRKKLKVPLLWRGIIHGLFAFLRCS